VAFARSVLSDWPRLKSQTTFTLADYNLTRMATIIGWRLNALQGEIHPPVAERQPKLRYGAQKPAEFRFQGATRI
jgi:hypothetical protein